MTTDSYGYLKALREERRAELEKLAPEPAQLQGYAKPVVLAGWSQEDFLWESGMASVRVAISTAHMSHLGLKCQIPPVPR